MFLRPGRLPVGPALLWFPATILNSGRGPVYIQFMLKRGAISLSESAGLPLLSGANYGLFKVVCHHGAELCCMPSLGPIVSSCVAIVTVVFLKRACTCIHGLTRQPHSVHTHGSCRKTNAGIIMFCFYSLNSPIGGI